jgi:hypothetical protein
MTDYITEELLLEVLDSKFEIHRDHKLEKELNHGLKDKIYPGHTNVMHSDHMRNNGHSVIRMMNNKHQIEYHLHNRTGKYEDHKLDRKSMLHSMAIIHNDAKFQLSHHRSIKIQANNKDQHDSYRKIAHHLVKGTDLKVKDVGKTERLDGSGPAYTHIIEEEKTHIIGFKKFLENIREQENT